ncbi:phenylalanine--tRNA ligase subunit alpha [Mycoplasma sp. CSL10137]|uniref:phenylalanine--tRNA ligase subunit alpha n=1 Tax=unclassified Mycoplasma TaxID=2683645 RepID=UPI00197C46E5|nr:MULTISPECIES: phenylalanine--tRNA ligase subunit alpha [unclassified Mycoplasma]MBN4083328.1 phenylalanine--tRNA ligase subunit alpha [Mycoplasma sp. CSL10137]MBN4084369.1 phenylalanine--tRNA ligase subunit alpha [Mycoplasma sp. CSL10166]MBU4692855.1 phenylalanine--tRNA ligase subunit alpha [Mycoplasma sp. CSL7491-lung]
MIKIDINTINKLEDLKKVKAELLGTNGEIFKLQQKIKTASVEEKKEIGRKINILKREYEDFFKLAELRIKDIEIQEKLKSSFVDFTEPVNLKSSLHPITIIEERLRDWFLQRGYYEQEDGEIVSDEFNFERLNIPSNHPARAMHDSLYFDPKTLLRTHNTGITARALDEYKYSNEKNKEVSIFSIGKVYRNDEDDATHSHQFTQLDFVSIGKVSFQNLIWTLKSLLSYVLEQEIEIRLRPSYFPFTEPSVEVDVFYKGRWIEILGAGMLHPKVLELAGYNAREYNGFAAGLGLERITMIKYGFTDIRDLYKNDLRILEQFKYEK